MRASDMFLTEAVMATLAIFAEMRHRSGDDQAAAERELRSYFPRLIADGEANRETLMVKGLAHLRQCEDRPRPLPRWMRRR
jgi:hypothetical protein